MKRTDYSDMKEFEHFSFLTTIFAEV